MNKPIFCFVGESGAGKSTYLDLVLQDKTLNLKELKYHTTRRKRYKEEDSYYFVSYEDYLNTPFDEIVEVREYDKVDEHVAYYTTYDDINIDNCDAIVCAASVDQVLSYKKKLENIYIIDIKVVIKERIKRLLDRVETNNEVVEVCRRVYEEREEYSRLDSIEDNIIHIYNDNRMFGPECKENSLYNLVTSVNLKTIIEYIKLNK